MNRLNKIINYFKVLSGIALITIGIYSEITILNELSDGDISFIDGEITYIYSDNDPKFQTGISTGARPINTNYHLLIGLGLVAGAILLNTTKLSEN